MKKLSNRVALITGGAQGLGKAIALAMAKEGATIVICDINAKTLPSAQSEIEATGARCLAVQCDVSSVDSVADLFRQTVSAFGTLDILVNNAALVQTGPRNEEMRAKFYKMMTTPVPKESLGVTKDFTDEEWHKYWGVNVHGVFYCTREALRIMEPKKSGKIINIASIAGIGGPQRPPPGVLRDQGRCSGFHPFGSDRGGRRQHLRQRDRRRWNPDATDGGVSRERSLRKPATPCIKSSRSGAWASRKNTPRSPSTSPLTSIIWSVRRSARTEARLSEAAYTECR